MADMIDKAEALATCPFCGAAFKMGQEPQDSPYVGGFFYLYHDYGPLGSEARKCPISVNGHYETEELAIAAWNRRAALPARGVGVDIEDMARTIYDAMRFDRKDKTPEWVNGGNSHAQVEARAVAARILAALEPALAPTDAAQAREEALNRLKAASAVLPEGPWEVWNSCSFRRITGPDGRDGGVLCGVVQGSDGHPDLSMPEAQLRALCDLVNAARSLISEART